MKTKANAYYDEKTGRHRFEAGSVIMVDGELVKVGGRFVTEAIADQLAFGGLVAFLNIPKPPKVAARKAQRRRRYNRDARRGFAHEWDGASKKRLYVS